MKRKIIILVIILSFITLTVSIATADEGDGVFFTGFKHVLAATLPYLKAALQWLVDAIVWVLQQIIKYSFKGFLEVAKGAIMAISLGDLAVLTAASWGYLNPNIAYLVVQTGIPEGLSILAIAYGIRIALNLIPASFTRI